MSCMSHKVHASCCCSAELPVPHPRRTLGPQNPRLQDVLIKLPALITLDDLTPAHFAPLAPDEAGDEASRLFRGQVPEVAVEDKLSQHQLVPGGQLRGQAALREVVRMRAAAF